MHEKVYRPRGKIGNGSMMKSLKNTKKPSAVFVCIFSWILCFFRSNSVTTRDRNRTILSDRQADRCRHIQRHGLRAISRQWHVDVFNGEPAMHWQLCVWTNDGNSYRTARFAVAHYIEPFSLLHAAVNNRCILSLHIHTRLLCHRVDDSVALPTF